MYYWDATKPDDSYTGKNIFFPIGRSGYGHRKREYIQNGIIPGRNRQIRKAYYVIAVRDISREVLPLTKSAPLFSALYYRPGAIYYAKNRTPIL